jgi:hypothetical protein
MNYFEFFTTNNKSGWKCRSSKLQRNNPEIFNSIMNFININNSLKDLPFVQQVYHFIFNLTSIPICSECNDKTPPFFDIRRGYQKFCSTTCSNRNKEKQEKVKQTNLNRYNSITPMLNPDIKKRIEEKNVINFGYKNPFFSKKIQKQAHDTLEKRTGFRTLFKSSEFRKKYNNKTSKKEELVCKKLNAEPKFVYQNYEFDLKVGNDIIEVDGDFFHPSKLENLTLIQIGSSINDRKKMDIVNQNKEYSLYKIHVSDIPEDFTIDELKQLSYLPNYTITPFQKIITKEYLTNYIEKKGKDKLTKYVDLLLKFIRIFHSEFPYQVYNESFDDVVNKIKNYDIDLVYNDEIKTFNNRISSLGNGYLKNEFNSFWNSRFKKSNTPVEIWNNDEIMKRVIAYRIGINNSGEVFDFSIKELIKGISAIRGTVSFFKPIVASSIYNHYLINHNNPIVFDPCTGFGGRMLGFKSKYPNGTYIGIEPNIDTYHELVSLGKKFENVVIYNCKLEDFNEQINYDIGFTSIPYFDLEEYSNSIIYESFNDWKNTFIKKLLTYPRLLINMSEKLCIQLQLTQYIDTYLSNQTSHLDKNKNSKKEVIIKVNF